MAEIEADWDKSKDSEISLAIQAVEDSWRLASLNQLHEARMLLAPIPTDILDIAYREARNRASERAIQKAKKGK